MTFRHEELRDFVESGDKEPPPVFVGRESILSRMERDAARAWKGAGAAAHGTPGMTNVVQGAPGAGKSAILSELKTRSTARTRATGRSRVLVLSSDELMISLPDVIRLVGVAGGLSDRQWPRLAGDLRVGANAILAKVEGGVSISGGTEDPLQHLLDLRKRFPPECWRGPVIVAVDEAQSLPGDEHGAHALFLQAIHRASTALPVTLVLAGLGDTVDRVGEMGLTRGRMDHAVGCFEDSDMVGVMRLFCERFGMNPTAHGDRLDALARPTEGWPRHIHFALQALGRQALAARGDLERVDWNGRSLRQRRVGTATTGHSKARRCAYRNIWSRGFCKTCPAPRQ